jgi:hypothetical protein
MSCAHSVLCFRKLSKLSFSLVPNSEFQTRSAFGKEKNESIRRNGDFPNCLFQTSFIFQTRSSKLGVPNSECLWNRKESIRRNGYVYHPSQGNDLQLNNNSTGTCRYLRRGDTFLILRSRENRLTSEETSKVATPGSEKFLRLRRLEP